MQGSIHPAKRKITKVMSERSDTKTIKVCGKRLLLATLCLLILPATALPQSSSWSLDPNHTHIEFQIRRVPVSNVRGSFGGIVGALVWDEKDPSKSRVEVTIPTGNISTNNASRDADLKSANFFDVQKYTTMTFRSIAVTGSAGNLQVIGNLTLAGVTKTVTLSVDGPTAAVRMGDKTIHRIRSVRRDQAQRLQLCLEVSNDDPRR